MAADLNNSCLTEKARDYAKLSLLAYADWKLSGGAWVLDAYKKDGGLRIGYQEYVDIWDELEAKGYSISDFHPNDATGFSATVFQKDGKQILAIRGSELLPPDPLDWLADGQLTASLLPPGQFESMVRYISDTDLANFDITGHSLGGYMAQAGKASFGAAVCDVYTYNAPGAKGTLQYTLVGNDTDNPGKVVVTLVGTTFTFRWDLSTWSAYQAFLSNQHCSDDGVYNISGKDFVSPMAGIHADIGSEVFIANSDHRIEPMINDLGKNLYYLNPRRPVSFIGSKADETINGDYNSQGYEDSPIQNLSIEGGYGDDTIYGSSGNDTLYGDLDNTITTESALRTTGNYGGEAGDDWLIGGKGNDTLIGGGGDDTYKITYGDGNDTVADSEGSNTIIYTDKSGKDRKVYTFFQNGTSTWASADGKLILVDNTIILEDGNSIVFSDTQPTDFGITLLDTPSDPVTTTTILADRDPLHLNDTLYDSAGNDRIEGRDGNDMLYGWQGGNDWFSGGSGRDGLSSGEGDDIIEGGTEGDLLFGAEGDDQLFGEMKGEMEDLITAGETAPSINEQGDLISGGAGDDLLYGSNRNDALFGGAGSDLLAGGGGDDIVLSGTDATAALFTWSAAVNTNGTYGVTFTNVGHDVGVYDESGDDAVYGGSGNDFVYTAGGDDEAYGGTGNDTIFGWGGSDALFGEDGDDVLVGDNDENTLAIDKHGDDYLDGGAGADLLVGYGGDDDLFGGEGNDEIYGDSSDIFSALSGDDTIDGEAGDDYIDAGPGADTVMGSEGADTIYGASGNDEIYGGEGNDQIDSGDGDDYLDGETGNDTLLGGAGADTIYGGPGTNWLQGDDGDDYLDGEEGDNTMLGGAGNDTIFGGTGTNRLQGDEGDDTLQGNIGIDTILGGAGMDSLWGGNGNDRLEGGEGNDQIDGGDGDDLLMGGAGDDTYYMETGRGNDIIQDDEGNNTIKFEGLNSSDVDYSVSPYQGDNGIVINLINTGEMIRLQNWFGPAWDTTQMIELLQYNNTTVSGPQVRERAMARGMNTTDLDEVLYAPDIDVSIEARGGNDVIYGGDGNDRLAGDYQYDWMYGDWSVPTGIDKEGNDSIFGGGGNDFILGGFGNDYLSGGSGNDDIYSDAGNDYADGGAGNDYLCDTKGNDTLNGGAGDDYIEDFSGDNALYGGDGNDEIHDSGGGNSTLDGGEGNDQLYGLGGDDIVYGGAGNDTLYGSGDYGEDGNDVLNGGAGDDLLEGGRGDDLYVWDQGMENDRIYDQAGVDTLCLGSLNVSDFTFDISTLQGDDGIILKLNSTGETLRLQHWFTVGQYPKYPTENKIERFQFADSELSASQIQQMAVEGGIVGTDSSDTIYAPSSYSTTIRGLGGNDYIRNSGGNDYIDGGQGDDTISIGTGNNTILWGSRLGNDTIRCPLMGYDGIPGGFNTLQVESLSSADVEFSIGSKGNTNNATVKIIATGETLTMIGGIVNRFQFADRDLYWWDIVSAVPTGGEIMIGDEEDNFIPGGEGNDTISGKAGNDAIYGNMCSIGGRYDLNGEPRDDTIPRRWVDDNGVIYGGIGNNQLYGNEGDDRLYGGVGRDNMFGGQGDDAYVLKWGYSGNDTIREEGGNDTIHMSTGGVYFRGFRCSVDYDEVIDNLSFNAHEDDLLLQNITTGEILRIEDWFGGSNYKIEQLIFNNYARLTSDQMEDRATAGWILGTDSNDIINSLSDLGAVIDGKAGDDLIHSGRGADTLYGEDGNDSLDGGMGADMLFGGDGDDTYSVDLPDDLVHEMYGAGNDTIRSSVTYTLPDNVENLILTGSSNIHGNGNDLANALTGNSGSNLLSTGAGNDILSGGTGNDILDGGTGNDTYLYNLGDGTDTVYDLDGNDVLVLGQGCDPQHVDYRIEGSSVHIGSIDRDGNISSGGVGVELANGLPVVEIIRFADGSEINLATLLDPANIVYGTNGFGMVKQGPGNDIVYAGEGVNCVRAGAGNDRIYGGAGAGTVFGEAGDDTIFGEAGSDLLFGGDGNDRLYGGTGIDVLTGGSGNDVLSGGGDSDILTGGSGSDTLTGGTGNDSFIDTAGSDTYLFAKGDGQDTLTDIGSDTSYHDTVRFDPSVLKETIALYQRGSTLTIGYGDTDTLRVTGQTTPHSGIEKIQLDDGLFLTNDDVNLVIQHMTAFAADQGIALTGIADVRANQDLMNIVASAWHS
ncbi:MAG: Bifunctional hemolysin/adenylate cyclase precursor [Syntrophorhabdus sp. PtaU1.Bin153]|nr:MAG: Bifunctional hemolysin/adenylate cyclase precursor [Syntrophorhabdus sp. PtaU1.Bin153]